MGGLVHLHQTGVKPDYPIHPSLAASGVLDELFELNEQNNKRRVSEQHTYSSVCILYCQCFSTRVAVERALHLQARQCYRCCCSKCRPLSKVLLIVQQQLCAGSLLTATTAAAFTAALHAVTGCNKS
jgi:hypothetical protein